MRIFELPKRDPEANFQSILDLTDRAVSVWEKKTGIASAFAEGESTAIVKKLKSQRADASFNSIQEDTQNNSPETSQTLKRWMIVSSLVLILVLIYLLLK
jgi:hypothetical protein